MRQVLAALVDAVLAAALAFAGFRVGLWSAPCRNMGSCFPLTPLIIVFVLAGMVLYFGLGYLAWRSTPGQHLFRASRSAPLTDDV